MLLLLWFVFIFLNFKDFIWSKGISYTSAPLHDDDDVGVGEIINAIFINVLCL